MQERAREADPIVSRGNIRERPCTETSLARREHNEVRREMEPEHLVYLEAAVLRTVPSQIHEREQGILLVEDPIRREV